MVSAAPYSITKWADTWHMEELFAGHGGVSAQDAWFSAGADLEMASLDHVAFAGGTLDLYKAFDQVCQPLLVAIFLLAGFFIDVLAEPFFMAVAPVAVLLLLLYLISVLYLISLLYLIS